MDRVVVPQFLDVEDKIIGPITVRQFIEILIGVLLIFIFYKIFDFSLFILLAFIVGVITLVIAFVKINGQSFHYFVLNFISTMREPKLKVWRKKNNIIIKSREKKETAKEKKILSERPIRRVANTSRLSELSLIVDTGGVYQGETAISNKL